MRRRERRLAWRRYAKCKGVDPNVFHADAETWADYKRIKARYCSQCLVQVECLLYALEHGITEGVWGGLNPGDRKLLSRHVEVRPRDSAPVR